MFPINVSICQIKNQSQNIITVINNNVLCDKITVKDF